MYETSTGGLRCSNVTLGGGKCHEEILSLQPIMLPPKKGFDNFPLAGGCSEGLDALGFQLKNTVQLDLGTFNVPTSYQ